MRRPAALMPRLPTPMTLITPSAALGCCTEPEALEVLLSSEARHTRRPDQGMLRKRAITSGCVHICWIKSFWHAWTGVIWGKALRHGRLHSGKVAFAVVAWAGRKCVAEDRMVEWLPAIGYHVIFELKAD